MITDEMVEKAVLAAMDSYSDSHSAMRAALEAVAPALIAQGMREAARMLTVKYPSHKLGVAGRTTAILARAQELEQK